MSTSKLYVGSTEEFTICEQSFRVSILPDEDHGTPWDNEDGHGAVSDWTMRDKRPGELILSEDRRSKRLYDFADACKIARRDGWGVPTYRLDIENGANGLHKARAKWFAGRELISIESDWCDDINDAISEVYAKHRDTFPTARAYAAAAAMADFERLRQWCADQWQYVGVVVETLDDEGEPTGESASLWGIESDADSYLWETARDLAAGMIAPQCAA